MHLRNLRWIVALAGVVIWTPSVFSQNGQRPGQQQTEPTGQAQPAAQNQGAPFAPPAAAAQQRLNLLLAKWETESKNTKTLVSEFTRWHYDPNSAPVGRHATWSKGKIQYATPDKGMFRVDAIQFYRGMEEERPIYTPDPNHQGEYWVCNGTEIMDFDRDKKQCVIQVLPPELRGSKIFESPLPFVFNLDANQLQERYWVRELPPEVENTFLMEAWPKNQQDRSQYLFVKIAVDATTFLPRDLMMFAPNFHPQTNVTYDHYQFAGMKKNDWGSNMQQFMGNFISVKPPSDWKVIRETFQLQPPQQAAAPNANAPLR